MRGAGFRKTSLPITIAAANTPQTIYIVSAGGTATRTAILRKIWIYSAVGNAVFTLGTGLAGLFVAAMPPMLVAGGIENIWTDEDTPDVEVGVNFTGQSTVLGIIVQLEVEEIGA